MEDLSSHTVFSAGMVCVDKQQAKESRLIVAVGRHGAGGGSGEATYWYVPVNVVGGAAAVHPERLEVLHRPISHNLTVQADVIVTDETLQQSRVALEQWKSEATDNVSPKVVEHLEKRQRTQPMRLNQQQQISTGKKRTSAGRKVVAKTEQLPETKKPETKKGKRDSPTPSVDNLVEVLTKAIGNVVGLQGDVQRTNSRRAPTHCARVRAPVHILTPLLNAAPDAFARRLCNSTTTTLNHTAARAHSPSQRRRRSRSQSSSSPRNAKAALFQIVFKEHKSSSSKKRK